MAAKQLVGLVGCEPFQGRQPSRGHNLGGHEKVHVIGHHNVRMQLITVESPLPIVQSHHHHLREFRAAQV